MTTEQAPNPKETQEFQFKLLARLRLFQENPQLPLKQNLSLVASASKFGLIFVGTATGFDVIQTARIVEQCAGVKKPTDITDFPRRPIQLGASPTHLDVSCDCTMLAVACAGVIRVYDVTSFTSQSERVVQEVRVLSAVHALSWNPGIPNMVAAVLQDGSASVYELKNNSFEIHSIPPEAQATCLCWSPKGKQIVIGSRNGSLNQFKPELKIVKSIPPPQGDWTMVNVHWLSNFQYAAVYSPHGQPRPSLVIVNTPKNSPITYINYDDITYSNGDNRTNQFYFVHQATWNVLLAASANSMEVGVLGRTGEAPWQQWQMEDAARAELPLSPSRQETHPVGMAFDTSPQHNLPWGENQHLPPMPLLLLLSHEGLLTLFWCVNLQPGSACVCVPPTPLPDASGLHLFTSGAASGPAQQTQPSPQKTQPVAVAAAPAFLASPTPVSFAPPASVTAPAPTPAQWQQQQAPATSQPAWTVPALSAAQSGDKSGSSWMSSPSLPSVFAPSSTAASAFATPAVSQTQPTFGAQPLSFAPKDSVAKPVGVFAQPSAPAIQKPAPIPTSVAPAQVPATLEIPAVSFPAQPPPTVRTPEPEVTEESEQLRKMNEALIQDSIREEIHFCNKELQQLRQRVCRLNVDVLSDADADKLAADTEEMAAFMRELKETTDAQGSEIDSLRNFILQSFSYVESTNTRLRLHNNTDYVGIQSSQGLDPIQARRMDDIRSNIQLMENMLVKLNSEIVDRWGLFQEANKENREVMHIPSMEAVYQAMVMMNNVVSKQKALLNQLEAKAKVHERKQVMGRVLGLLNVSRMVEDGDLDRKETDVSKIAGDFLALNLKKFSRNTTVDELQESIADFSLTNHSLRDMSTEKAMLMRQVFKECQLKHLNVDTVWSSPQGKVMTGTFLSGSPRASSTPEAVKQSFNKVKSVDKSPFTMSVNKNLSFGNNAQISSPTVGAQPLSSNAGGEQPPNWVCSSCKSPEAAASVSQVSTQTVSQPVFAPQATTASKGFSFAPVAATQVTPSFSSQSPAFGSATTSAQPASTGSQPFVTFSKTFTFTTASATTGPAMFGSGNAKTETPKLISNSSVAAPVPAPANPLASLSSLVSGIEPLKPAKESPVKNKTPGDTGKSAGSQPFVFKVPAENKSSPSKESEANPPKTSSFSFSVENKPDSPSSTTAGDGKNQFSGAFKKLSFESTPTKSIFGGNPTSLSFDAAKPEQTTKNIFGFSNTSSPSAFFSGNATSVSSPNQKPTFGISVAPVSPSANSSPPVMQVKPVEMGQAKESEADANSPIIEVCLTPPNSGTDPKTSIEKLENIKGITITKVESPGSKTESQHSQSDNTSSSLFGPSSFTTPTKPSSNIFGGSPLAKPTVTYEVLKPETQPTSPENTEVKKDSDTSKPPTLFGGTAPTSASASPFSFSTPSKDSTQSGTGFTFGLKTAATTSTTTAVTSSQATSSFSFAQTATTAAPAFSFSLAASSTTSAGSTFGIGGLSTAVSTDDKTKPTFSFGQQIQTPTTTAASIFGGFGVKPAEGATAFGQPPAGTDQTKSIFGAPATSSENKSVFGTSTSETKGLFGAPTTTSETKSLFGAPTSTSETKSLFGSLTTTSETKSLFGSSTTTSETKSLFGASTTTSETKSLFGSSTTTSEAKSLFGTPATTSEAKSIFGTAVTSSETKSIFGTAVTSSETKSIFGASSETKSIFGTPASGSETKSIFGTPATSAGTLVTATETKSVFGQPAASENKSLFGQPPASGAEAKSDFSFSLSSLAVTSTAGQTSFFGSPATNNTSFFGQQVCSPTSSANSPFGQPATTPSVFGTPTFGSSTTFGQSGTSLFGGQASGGFGTSGGTMFGGGFGSTQPSSPFGSSTGGSSSMFGGGSFSAGGQSVGQTGFGSPAFQNKPAPAFGSTSPQPAFGAPPAFGAAPTFGGSPAFGSPPKVFGSPTAPAPAFGSTQQSSTFENLANQNTMTFGNIAQNQTPVFGGGSMFGGAQQPAPAPAFAPATTSASFGGSSFTSWR